MLGQYESESDGDAIKGKKVIKGVIETTRRMR